MFPIRFRLLAYFCLVVWARSAYAQLGKLEQCLPIPSYGSELEEPIPGSDPCRTVDDDMRSDDGAGTDLHIRANDAEGSHGHVRRKLCLWRNQGMWIDHFPVSGATIMSACATSVSPTSAVVEKRQIPFRARSRFAISTS